MAVDTEARAVGRHGAVTLDEAAAAARKLHEFTRADLAAELGIKPIAVGRFLTGLTERKMAEPDEDGRGLFYRCLLEPLATEVFLPPEPEPEVEPDPEPEPAVEEVKVYGRVTAEEVRDWALMLERFTVHQLAREMEVAHSTAKRHVERLCEQGIIVDSGWKGAHDSVLYEVRGEVRESHLRRQRRPPVEEEVLAKWKPTQPQRGVPVPTGDIPRVSNSSDIMDLVRLAVAFGWGFETRRSHHVIVPPQDGARPITIPSGPGSSKVLHGFRKQLRDAGLPDLGRPNQTIEDAVPTPGRGVTVGSTSRTAKRRQATMNVAGTRRPGRKNQGRHNKT